MEEEEELEDPECPRPPTSESEKFKRRSDTVPAREYKKDGRGKIY